MPSDKEILGQAEKQIGAIIAKLMEALEESPIMRTLHPSDFDNLRKSTIKSIWGAYTVGIRFGEKLHRND